MAFVIPRSDKQAIKPSNISFPGPGTYLDGQSNKKIVQHCAPFNKSQLKRSIFEVQPTNYGPGYYEPLHQKDISQPTKTNPNSHMFMSKVQRFQQPQSSNSPNPHKTNESKVFINHPHLQNLSNNSSNTEKNNEGYKKCLEKSKETMKDLRKNNNQKKVQSIRNNKDFVRVILASTTNTETHVNKFYHKSVSGKTLGPGSYADGMIRSKPKSLSNWERQKPMRFSTDGNQVPGPGSYESENLGLNKGSKLSASFACTEMRSHLDSLIYRTNIPLKAVLLQKKKIKDNIPGPGSYNPTNTHNDKKSFNYNPYTLFGTQSRNPIPKNPSQQILPGPGAYQQINLTRKVSKINNTIKQMRHQIFGKKKSLVKSRKIEGNRSLMHEEQFVEERHQRKNRLNKKVYSMEERCFSRFGNMAQQQRFKDKLQRQPGPGQYSETKDKTIQKNISSVFRSQTKREVFAMKPSESYTQFYNINKKDIGYKAQKMKRYIQNLRKINIERTPFQSSAKRFEQPQIPQNQQDRSIDFLQNRHSIARKQIHIQKTNQPTSSFISKSKRNVFTNDRISQNKQSSNNDQLHPQQVLPGPGQYNIKTNYQGNHCSLQKKSFNRHYNNTDSKRREGIKYQGNESKEFYIERHQLIHSRNR